jgi:hypothetical protein
VLVLPADEESALDRLVGAIACSGRDWIGVDLNMVAADGGRLLGAIGLAVR